MEAGIALDTCQVQGDDRDLLHVCLLQGTADEADDNGGLVQVIFAGQQSFHDLSDYQQRGIAGIVVNIFQTYIHGVLVVIVQYDEIVTAGIERRL